MDFERLKIRNRVVLTGAFVVLVCVGGALAGWAAVTLPSSDLPPEPDPVDCGALISHYWSAPSSFPSGLVNFSGMSLKCFENVVRTDIGPDERQDHDATLVTTVDIGLGPEALTLTGPMQTLVYSKVGATTGTFNAEIVALSLTGTASSTTFILRESPSLSSSGMTSITDVGGGNFDIDSFYDLFSELSIDGGQTWLPVEASQRLTLVGIEVPVELQSFDVE